jgi:hypothetical protein
MTRDQRSNRMKPNCPSVEMWMLAPRLPPTSPTGGSEIIQFAKTG